MNNLGQDIIFVGDPHVGTDPLKGAKVRLSQHIDGLKKLYGLRKIIKTHAHTIVLGDMGVNPIISRVLKGFNREQLQVLGGNRDNQERLVELPGYLGDYGVSNIGDLDFSFLRGAKTQKNRKYISDKEELTENQIEEADLFFKAEKNRKDIMTTHSAPYSIRTEVSQNIAFSPSQDRTAIFLDKLFTDTYQPKIWIFAHDHTNFYKKVGNTKFIGLKDRFYLNGQQLAKINSQADLNHQVKNMNHNYRIALIANGNEQIY